MMTALWAAACCLLFFSSRSGVEGIGVNYGLIGDNLPSPDKVVSLYLAHNITDVRLFHPDTAVLDALRGSGLGVVLGTLNSDLAPLASDASYAASWVSSYVAPYAPSVRFRYVNAGNEVVPGEGSEHVLQAIQNLESALAAAGIGGDEVRVTTAVATSVLGASFPPSRGAFSEASLPVMAPLVSYLAERGSPLLVNAYPYFAYAADPSSVPLDYALLSPSAAAAVTDDDGVRYANMFDAIVDAVHAAAGKVAGSNGGVELVVSETGWPSGGGGYGASVENAAAYVNNLVRHVGSGTPRRPGKAVETYVFAMFNENQKPEGVERYFGLFQPDMTEVYHVDF